MSEFLSFAADAMIKATVLLLTAALAAQLFRRSSAAMRHMIWALAIGGAVAMPLLVLGVPFELPVLPLQQADAVIHSTDRVDHSRDRGDVPVTAFRTAADPPAASIPAFDLFDAELQPHGFRWMNVATVSLAIWITGMLVLLGRFLAGLSSVRRIARRAVPVTEPAWLELADRAARRMGIVAAPDMRISDAVVMPFACGLAHPVIVLPASSAAWTAERREAVLLHELAHIIRGDLAMNVLSHVARAAYWFNPLAWLAAHRLRVEGERACDDEVLRRGALASDYAEHLLSIVRSVGRGVPAAALAMARPSDFEGRLLAILAPEVSRVPITRGRAAAIAAAFLVGVAPLAAMSPARGATAAPSAETALAASTEFGAPNQQVASPRPVSPQPEAPATREPASREIATVQGRQSQQPGAVEALSEALADADASVRIAAAKSLGSVGDPRAIAALAKALKSDSDARVREAAAQALGEIDDPRAVPALVDALRSERVADVKVQIIEALEEIDDASAASAITAVVRDSSIRVRRAAASALGELEDRAVIPALLSMARDDDAEVRMQVAEALGDLEAVAGLDALVAMTRDANAEVRARALSSLSDLEDNRAMPAMLAALKDSDPEVRLHAAEAIDNLEDIKTAPAALIAAVGDSSAEVREAVAHALGNIGDQAAVPALRRLVGDNVSGVRRAAAEALSDVGGVDAIQTLMQLLKDPDPEIRRIAAEALGNKDR